MSDLCRKKALQIPPVHAKGIRAEVVPLDFVCPFCLAHPDLQEQARFILTTGLLPANRTSTKSTAATSIRHHPFPAHIATVN